jgi:hypothetical protein
MLLQLPNARTIRPHISPFSLHFPVYDLSGFGADDGMIEIDTLNRPKK